MRISSTAITSAIDFVKFSFLSFWRGRRPTMDIGSSSRSIIILDLFVRGDFKNGWITGNFELDTVHIFEIGFFLGFFGFKFYEFSFGNLFEFFPFRFQLLTITAPIGINFSYNENGHIYIEEKTFYQLQI